jgi:hypothetical protein
MEVDTLKRRLLPSETDKDSLPKTMEHHSTSIPACLRISIPISMLQGPSMKGWQTPSIASAKLLVASWKDPPWPTAP